MTQPVGFNIKFESFKKNGGGVFGRFLQISLAEICYKVNVVPCSFLRTIVNVPPSASSMFNIHRLVADPC